MELAVEAKTVKDAQRLGPALNALAEADPRLTWAFDPERGQAILKGDDELHLDGVVGALLKNVKVLAGAPQVAYLETITAGVIATGIHRRIVGGTGEFAKVVIDFQPARRELEFEFVSEAGEAVPDQYLRGVSEGLEQASANGLLAGFPVVDFKATLVDGAFHDIDSSPKAFKLAAMSAFKQIGDVGKAVLMEPIMFIRAEGPRTRVSEVEAFLLHHRGVRRDRGEEFVEVLAPLANLFGFHNAARARFGTEVTFERTFSHYAQVPQQPSPDPQYPFDIGMRA